MGGGPALLSNVKCSGSETELHLCSHTVTNGYNCNRSAGVICISHLGNIIAILVFNAKV